MVGIDHLTLSLRPETDVPVVPVAVMKRSQWVRDRGEIKDTFYHDWEKMQRILKAGYPKPVSLAMNDDVKVMVQYLTDLFAIFSLLLSALA